MKLKLIPITTHKEAMEKYLIHTFCNEVFEVFKKLYPKIGFNLPWIGYFALVDDEVVGVGGFKGSPTNGTVEIGYGTVPGKEGRGYATIICNELTRIALIEDPELNITARTLMESNASTKILEKNGYRFSGIVHDPEDGDVWEWQYDKELGDI